MNRAREHSYLDHPGRVVLDRRFVAAAHARALKVHVWTVNDADRMVALVDLGVDGIMTDRIATLRSVLTGRGVWADPVARTSRSRVAPGSGRCAHG